MKGTTEMFANSLRRGQFGNQGQRSVGGLPHQCFVVECPREDVPPLDESSQRYRDAPRIEGLSECSV